MVSKSSAAIRSSIPKSSARCSTKRRKLQMGTTTHMAQTGVVRTNVIQAARLGMGSMEHWYGLPESLFADRVVQDFPLDYNYNDEQHRFGQAGRLWKQAAAAGQQEMERGHGRADQAQLHDRSDVHDLRSQPRPDARNARRMARQIHSAVALEVLSAQPRSPRLVLVQLDDAGRDRMEEQLPALDGVRQRVQESRRASHYRVGFGLHLSRHTASNTYASWSYSRRRDSIRSK